MNENDCQERREHGQATEPRFEITLPPQPADEVFGSLLEADDKDLEQTG
jgi:hypothetical protein